MERNFNRYHEDRFWSAAFIAVFLLIAWVGYACLERRGLLPSGIAVFDFFLLALAIFRLIRLVSYDAIFSSFRDLFQDKTVVRFIEGEERKIALETSKHGWKRAVSMLLACPWCTGLWIALFVTFVFFSYPGLWIFFLLLALSGVASLIQVALGFLGQYAHRRRE